MLKVFRHLPLCQLEEGECQGWCSQLLGVVTAVLPVAAYLTLNCCRRHNEPPKHPRVMKGGKLDNSLAWTKGLPNLLAIGLPQHIAFFCKDRVGAETCGQRKYGVFVYGITFILINEISSLCFVFNVSICISLSEAASLSLTTVSALNCISIPFDCHPVNKYLWNVYVGFILYG